jgi:hypothetical protein
MKNRDEVSKELSSHKLNETTAILLKMIVAIGIYPQFAVEDPHNNHRVYTSLSILGMHKLHKSDNFQCDTSLEQKTHFSKKFFLKMTTLGGNFMR